MRSTTPSAGASRASGAPASPPPGFDVFPGQEPAARRIRDRLARTQDDLDAADIPADIHVHRYRDGTVDGELSVQVTRGVDAIALAKQVEAAFGTGNLRGVWFSVGTRFGVREADSEAAEERYRRNKGMFEASMYYRKMYSADGRTRRGIFGDAFGTMEHRVIGALQDRYERKVVSVFVRMHWNPENRKPRR